MSRVMTPFEAMAGRVQAALERVATARDDVTEHAELLRAAQAHAANMEEELSAARTELFQEFPDLLPPSAAAPSSVAPVVAPGVAQDPGDWVPPGLRDEPGVEDEEDWIVRPG